MLSVNTFVFWCCALAAVQAVPAPTVTPTAKPTLKIPKPRLPSFTRAVSASRVTSVASHGSNHTVASTGGKRVTTGTGYWNSTQVINGTGGIKPSAGVSIMTDPEFGIIIGCTKPITITSAFLYYTKGQAACNGGYTIGTDSAIYSSYKAKQAPTTTQPWLTVTAPASGCATVTVTGADDNYCTCAGGMMEGLIRGVAITGKSKGQATTVCGSIPTGYVPIPRVVPKSPSYLQAPTGDCADGSITHTECWDKLDMKDYVPWWWQNFSKHCQGLGFADCFYALATPYSPSKCGQLNVDAQCKQPSWSDFEGDWNGIRNFYIAQNIWNFNSFFVNYWVAIGQAQSTAEAMLGNLIKTVNPVAKTNVALNDVLTALSVGLAFLPGPEGEISKAMMTAGNQAITVNKFMFPEGTLGSQTEDWDSITGKIAGLTQNLQDSVTKALAALQNSTDNFLPYANTGTFSSGLPPLNDLKNQILLGFNTFMVSQAYQTKGIIITRVLDTDVHALQTNGTKLYWDTHCEGGYDQYGTCDTFWYDSDSKITYALTDGNSLTHNFNSDMQTLFYNYTTGAQLLAGADACAQASKSSQGSGPNVSTDPKTGVSASCLSNMKVCTWSLTVPSNGGNDTPLLDCNVRDVIPRWGISGCIGPGGDTSTNAPRQYLGWGIQDNDKTENSYYTFCDNVDV